MSTRCNIHFNHGKTLRANIYVHSDGYPGKVKDGEQVEYGVLSDFLDFFRLLVAEVPDNRLRCAEQLAAKFLVHKAKELAKYGRLYLGKDHPDADEEGRGPEHHLQFLSVSPCILDHYDIEYVYEVDCDKLDDEGFPIVRWKTAAEGARFRTVKLGRKGSKAA